MTLPAQRVVVEKLLKCISHAEPTSRQEQEWNIRTGCSRRLWRHTHVQTDTHVLRDAYSAWSSARTRARIKNSVSHTHTDITHLIQSCSSRSPIKPDPQKLLAWQQCCIRSPPNQNWLEFNCHSSVTHESCKRAEGLCSHIYITNDWNEFQKVRNVNNYFMEPDLSI